MKNWTKQLYATPGIVIVLLIFIAQFWQIRPIDQASQLLFDSYQQAKPREHVPVPVRVIDIDDESIKRIGQWPWPRTDIAKLNDYLTDAGASAIAYDIVFAEADRTSPELIVKRLTQNGGPAAEGLTAIANLPNHDDIFAQSLKQSPAITGYFLDTQDNGTQMVPKVGMNLSGTLPEGSMLAFQGAIAPIEKLADAAPGTGFVTILGDGDGIVRKAPMLAKLKEDILPSLSLDALRVAQQAGSITVKSSDGSGETDDSDPKIVAVKVGAFEVPLTEAGELYVYFREAVENQSIAAWRLLEGDLSIEEQDELFSGHIILVGAGAQGLRDLKATPLSDSELGVNVHAQAIEQIISGQFLVRPDWALGLERALLLLAGIGMALSLPYLGALRGAMLGAVSVAAIAGGSWYAFSANQFLLNPIYPLLAMSAAYIMVTLTTYYREERQRAYIHNAFDRYLSPDLVKQIVDDPGQLELGGEEREMTVMFCDIRSFSRISESLSPQDIIRFLIAFLTPMTDLLLERKATIDKYIGDAILAFWNAPLLDEDQHKNAARGALEMVGRLRSLNTEMQAQSDEPWPGEVKIGIGLNSGPCCVGNMGSSQRLSYSLIGDTVNLASRIEGLTKQYGVQVAIGSALEQHLSEFAHLEIDRVRVVGRDTAETIFVLLGDEEMALEAGFQSHRNIHQTMLSAYRAQNWGEALEHIAALENGAERFALQKLYGIYKERISAYQSSSPGSDWDGVFEATEK